MTEATAIDIRNIPFTTADGTEATLSDYDGQVLLIVNVASRCGLAPQYEQLEQLKKTYGPRGFDVLALPEQSVPAGAVEDGRHPRVLLDDVGRHLPGHRQGPRQRQEGRAALQRAHQG